MLNRVLCIVQCWNISIVTSIKLFQLTSCNLLKNKIAHSLLSNGFFTELNRTLLEQNVNNYLKPSHLLSWFHATQEYATQYTLNPRLIENTLLAQFCKFLRVWKGILGSGIWPEIYCGTRENAKFFERDTRFDRYSRGGIRQSLDAGWFIRKKAVFGRDDRRSKCGIVVIRTPPLPDPGPISLLDLTSHLLTMVTKLPIPSWKTYSPPCSEVTDVMPPVIVPWTTVHNT